MSMQHVRLDSSIRTAGVPSSKVRSKKRQATLYDAVAGRVGKNGFIDHQTHINARGFLGAGSASQKPEEVLFRKKDAPERYEETDTYFAADTLPSGALPDSDLLKALHVYTAEFYERNMENGGVEHLQTLDETALLALGILMEELCKDVLGETGDLVLTEGKEVGVDDDQDHATNDDDNIEPEYVQGSVIVRRLGRPRKTK